MGICSIYSEKVPCLRFLKDSRSPGGGWEVKRQSSFVPRVLEDLSVLENVNSPRPLLYVSTTHQL